MSMFCYKEGEQSKNVYTKKEKAMVKAARSGEYVGVDGDKIAALLRARKMTQKTLSTLAGVTHYRMSNICQPGISRVFISTAENIAKGLGVQVADILPSPEEAQKDIDDLEGEVLRMYRELTPKQKIQVLSYLQSQHQAR